MGMPPPLVRSDESRLRSSRWSRRRIATATVAALAAVAGLAAGTALALPGSPEQPEEAPAALVLFHSPPAVAVAGESVDLTFMLQGDLDPGALDEATGVVHFGDRDIALAAGTDGLVGSTGQLPGDTDEISYWAEVQLGEATARFPASGGTVTLRVQTSQLAIDASSVAPVESASVARAAETDDLVLDLPWGSGSGQVGRESGPSGVTGPAAFDVAPDGSIVIADQVNKRLLVARGGEVVSTLDVDLSVSTEDVVVDDGIAYVSSNSPDRAILVVPLDGSAVRRVDLGEGIIGGLSLGDDGAYYKDYLAGGWVRCAQCEGSGSSGGGATPGPVIARPVGDQDVTLSVESDHTLVRIESKGSPDFDARVSTPSGGFVPIVLLEGGDLVFVQQLDSTLEGSLSWLYMRGDQMRQLDAQSSVDIRPSGRFSFTDGNLYMATPDEGSYKIERIG